MLSSRGQCSLEAKFNGLFFGLSVQFQYRSLLLVSLLSNCSRSHASLSRGLDNVKGTKIVGSAITLDSSIKALLLAYLFCFIMGKT